MEQRQKIRWESPTKQKMKEILVLLVSSNVSKNIKHEKYNENKITKWKIETPTNKVAKLMREDSYTFTDNAISKTCEPKYKVRGCGLKKDKDRWHWAAVTVMINIWSSLTLMREVLILLRARERIYHK